MLKTPNPGSVTNAFSGVAVTSATNAWAVGNYSNSGTGLEARSLIAHWNGTAWKQQPSPSPGSGFNALFGVAATSATNAWAVGRCDNGVGTSYQTLIVHWNGTGWKQVSSPNVTSTDNQLNGVAATSATNGWAVGASGDFQGNQSLIMHWNGTAGNRYPAPRPPAATYFRA